MTPDWRSANPYQQLLADALTRNGTEIHFPKGYRRVFPLFRALLSVQPRADILHIHWHEAYVRSSSFPGQVVYAAKLVADLLAVKATGCRIVWTLHNEVPHDSRFPRLFRVLQSVLAKLSDGIIMHSRISLDSVRSQLKASAEKVEIIPHGRYNGFYGELIPRAEARRLLGLPAAGKILLYFGLICPYKGVEDLLQAWRRLGSEVNPSHLVIVGQPETEAYAQSIAAQAEGLSSVVFRPGFVPIRDVRLYFSAADCAVLPFRKILTSGSLSLALGYSLPLIVPDLNTVRAEVASEYGLFFIAGDVDSLISAIRQAINSPSPVGNHENGLWDWNSVADATRKVYRSVRPLSNMATIQD